MEAALLLVVLSCVLGGILAIILRLAGLWGSARAPGVLAGIITGVLLGPLVLGAVAPELHARLVSGGVDEMQALRTAETEHATEITAAAALEMDEQGLAALTDQWNQEKAALEADLVEALEERTSHVRLVQAALAGLILGPLFAAAALRLTARRRGMTAAVAISGGLGAVLLGSLLPMVVASAGLDADLPNAVAFALVMATLGCWWSAPPRIAAIGAMGLAIGTGAMGALLLAMDARIPLAVALASLLLTAIPCAVMCASKRRPIAGRRLWERITAFCLIPMLVGVVVARLDPSQVLVDVRFVVATVFMLLFASDGRWMSISFVWRLLAGPRRDAFAWMHGARLVSAGAGMAQLALLGLALAGGLIDAPLTASAVIGALAVEIMAGARVRIARRAITELSPE